ncbi:UNVERIFIED_CONTAM: hypothetical protein HDU68_010336 [Siphonaria sp. JEL0065]|nr:hypothetical protein HDU68_010336 [Siphonaria sp. JEL0065]
MLALLLLISCNVIFQTAASPVPGGPTGQQTNLVKQWNTTGNQYPTVFIHGWLGWGEANPRFGIQNYWGGVTQNILDTLRSQGYVVSAPGVGPLSSNWERAAEAFAQITATRTDYGVARSHQFGHKRFGQDHTGKPLVPGFLKNGSSTKINLVAHSMGGPTARLLVHLLCANTVCSPLYWTNRTQSYVNGVFSIAGVYQGTPFDDYLQSNSKFFGFIKKAILSLVGINDLNNLVYDLQLSHWGLSQQPNESVESYFARVEKSQWLNTKSNALFDLSVKSLNDPLISFVKNVPEVTYFSSAGITTTFDGQDAHAEDSTLIFLIPAAEIIGSYSNASLPILSTFTPKEWRQNDGLVPLASSRGPTSGFVAFPLDLQSGNENALALSAPRKTPGKGVFNFVGSLDETDHMALIGSVDLVSGLRDRYYLNILSLLSSLSA